MKFCLWLWSIKMEQLYAIISYQIIQVAMKSSGNMRWVFRESGNKIKYFWFESILEHAQFQSKQADKLLKLRVIYWRGIEKTKFGGISFLGKINQHKTRGKNLSIVENLSDKKCGTKKLNWFWGSQPPTHFTWDHIKAL